MGPKKQQAPWVVASKKVEHSNKKPITRKKQQADEEFEEELLLEDFYRMKEHQQVEGGGLKKRRVGKTSSSLSSSQADAPSPMATQLPMKMLLKTLSPRTVELLGFDQESILLANDAALQSAIASARGVAEEFLDELNILELALQSRTKSPWDLMIRVGDATLAGGGSPVVTVVLLSLNEADESWSTYTQGPQGPELNTLPITEVDKLVKLFPKYQVRPSGAHGLGMFATCRIDPIEVILRERRLWLFGGDLRELAELSDSQVHILGQLHNAKPECIISGRPAGMEIPEPHRDIIGIYNTNSFANAGICPVLSHCNHSCDPNAAFIWDEERKVELLWALRPIEVGEEILVDYCGELDSTEKRASRLRGEKGIDACNCPHCTADFVVRRARDAKLQRIRGTDDLMPRLGNNPTEAITKGEEAFRLCDEVGNLVSHKRRLTYDVFQIVAQQPYFDPQVGKLWAQRHLEATQLAEPAEMKSTAEIAKLISYTHDPSLFAKYREDEMMKHLFNLTLGRVLRGEVDAGW